MLFRTNSAFRGRFLVGFGVASLTLLIALPSAAKPRVGAATMADTEANTVYFPSGDGQTELVGYVFKPAGRRPFPAIVMLHGRAGPYSANVSASCTFVRRGERSPCNAETQSMRAKMWGAFWAERGVLAIHVDSFGPRGRGHGFGRNTHSDADRDAVNELTVRPLDAEGTLEYLHQRGDIKSDRIAIQGWSNGASTTLNVMYRQVTRTTRSEGFKQALVFYPGCGNKAILSTKAYEAGAPTTVFLGGDDEEVNPDNCRKALTGSHAGLNGAKGSVEIVWYDGVTHDFDDPGKSRQAVLANVSARIDSMTRAARIISLSLLQ